jgi:NADPH:quinone reductase-like Zn-dependent oxidoreductase
MTSKTQKALFLESKQGRFIVRDKDIPKPGNGELLVKVKAAALNPIDWKIQKDPKYANFVTSYPAVLGGDVAGDVQETGGGVTEFSKGERVCVQMNLTSLSLKLTFATDSSNAPGRTIEQASNSTRSLRLPPPPK